MLSSNINHKFEIEVLLTTHHIDIILLSATQHISRNYFKIRGYNTLTTNAHGGTTILIKRKVIFIEITPTSKMYFPSLI